MKKILLSMLFCGVLASSYAGDEEGSEFDRHSHLRVSFVGTQFKDPNSTIKFDSDWGVSIARSRTFNLHEPIANVLCFGIEATWLDLTYQQYGINKINIGKWTYYSDKKLTVHQGEVSMGIGPSVTIIPVGKLAIRGYFQYLPTCAIFGDKYDSDGQAYVNYASFFSGGGNISYGAIGLGVEYRWGSPSYKCVYTSEGDKSDYEFDSKVSGYRAYIVFHF